MSLDSDTESEPETVPGTDAGEFLALHQCPHENFAVENSAKGAREAIDILKTLDISAVCHNTDLHNSIQDASGSILGFLDGVVTCSLLLQESTSLIFSTLASIREEYLLVGYKQRLTTLNMHFSFFFTLFDYRRVFHDIAAQSLPPGAIASTNISWVDVVFAKLSEVVVIVAAGFASTSSEPPMSQFFREKRNEDTLRAAAQLPHKWQDVPAIIVSERTSPAAKRLALRLTFASYILGPHIDSQVIRENGSLPVGLISILQDYLNKMLQRGSLDMSSSADHRIQERIAYAMIVSLFAAADIEQSKSLQVVSSFRPRSLSALLRLIQAVMHPAQDVTDLSLVSPMKNLDSAQSILVRWGDTIPWCWSVWDDPRLIHVETITFLTVSWLYHLNNRNSETITYDVEAWSSILTKYILQNPAAAGSAFLQLLYHCLDSLYSASRGDIFPVQPDVLFKACWASAQLASLRTHQQSSQKLCKCLCAIFVAIGTRADVLDIKELVIEAFTYFDPDTRRLAFKEAKDDTKLLFESKLDENLTRCISEMVGDTGRLSLQWDHLRSAKLMLNFLTVMWHCDTRGCLHPQTATSFLNSLVQQLLLLSSTSLPSKLLWDSVLTTLATAEVLRTDPAFGDVRILWDDENIWRFSLRCGSANLSVASAFAYYLQATRRICDSLCCAEAWDYLRDVLLLVFSHHFLGDDEPLALLVCPIICEGLLCLLQHIDSATGYFILNSPWTLKLCGELQMLQKDNTPCDEYRIVLKERLSVVGQTFLDQMLNELHTTVKGDRKIIEKDLQNNPSLLFIRSRPISRLMLVPRV